MPSAQFKNLRSNLAVLRKHLLPNRFKADLSYNDRVYTNVLAYVVLCHGAFEEYFETRVIEIAQSALKALTVKQSATQAITAIVAYRGSQHDFPPSTFSAPQPSQLASWAQKVDFKEKARDCVSRFINKVKSENHGIRERNLAALLVPIGVSVDDVDNLLLNELDSYGKRRGGYAHSGVLGHVSQRRDPFDEYKKVKDILLLISPLDEILNERLNETKR